MESYKEFLDITEQIEKGIKWDRIPMLEAIQSLRSLRDKHLQSPKDGLKECLSLMEQIGEAIKGGQFPTDATTAILKVLNELNESCPVEES